MIGVCSWGRFDILSDHTETQFKPRSFRAPYDLFKLPIFCWLSFPGPPRPNTMRVQDKHNDIDMKALNIRGKIRSWKTYDLLKGKWNDSEVVVKLLKIPKSVTHAGTKNGEAVSLSNRHVREFAEEYAKTRIFSHQNLLPALGAVNKAEVL